MHKIGAITAGQIAETVQFLWAPNPDPAPPSRPPNALPLDFAGDFLSLIP